MSSAYSTEDIRVIIGFLTGRIPELHGVKMGHLNNALKEAFAVHPPSIELVDFSDERLVLLKYIEDLENENRILKS